MEFLFPEVQFSTLILYFSASFFQKDQDGKVFKAALLSGPPGVGKTTTSQLVCQELGFSYIEMNASDSRNKKTLEQSVSQLLNNKSMDGFLTGEIILMLSVCVITL